MKRTTYGVLKTNGRDDSGQTRFTKRLGEFAIFAQLMFLNLFHLYNGTRIAEYRQVMERRFAIIWTNSSD